MTQYASPIDITQMPELKQIAEQVRCTRQAVPLTQDDEVIAVVQPAPKRGKGRTRARAVPIPRTDSIFNIIGLGSSDAPTDVSANVDAYLADAYYEELHPPTKP